MTDAWNQILESLMQQPIKYTRVTVRMPTDRDESSSIIRSTCDGIYPIRNKEQSNEKAKAYYR